MVPIVFLIFNNPEKGLVYFLIICWNWTRMEDGRAVAKAIRLSLKQTNKQQFWWGPENLIILIFMTFPLLNIYIKNSHLYIGTIAFLSMFHTLFSLFLLFVFLLNSIFFCVCLFVCLRLSRIAFATARPRVHTVKCHSRELFNLAPQVCP